MKTDKQLFKVFQACPEWLYLLAKQPSPGNCRFDSLTVKELERRLDGLVVPDDSALATTVFEFQFQKDVEIYNRVVVEMAAAERAYAMRTVQGIIFFQSDSLDDKPEPWCRIVQSVPMQDALDELERNDPQHPLVAVCKPLSATESELDANAVAYYRKIKRSQLPELTRATLSEVFVSWLEQRFKSKSKREIEIMLIGELPELEDTQSGKDLIAIGEKRGEKRGLELGEKRAAITVAEAKFGALPNGVTEQIKALGDASITELLNQLVKFPDLADLQAWLDQA